MSAKAVQKEPRRRARPDSELTRKLRNKGYLLCTEVAKKVGVHKATLYRWIRDGVVKALDFNGAYYVDWSSVVEHMGKVAKVLELDKNPPKA